MTSDQDFTITDNNRQLEKVAVFNADEPLTLLATNASGRIEVNTDPNQPSGTVHVAVRRTDDNEFDDDDHALIVKSDGNSISIHPDWQFAAGFTGLARRVRDQLQHGFRPEDWNLSRLKLSPELDFHFFVTLPANLAEGSEIKLRTASGEIDARDIAARVSVVTASGDVGISDLTGVVAINTASGDARATNINESLEINTASGDASIKGGDIWLAVRSASGDVSVEDTRLRNSRLTTVSGDISIRATLDNTGNYGMETVSGDVSLHTTLPGQNTIATLGFGTLSGSSHVAPAWEKRKRREWSAGSGDAGASVNIKTVSGDLSAEARLDDSVEARTLAMPRGTKSREDRDTDFEYGTKDLERDLERGLRQGMKHLEHGMRHLGHVAPPTPPTPPAPPEPPSHWDEESTSDYERAMQDYEKEVERQFRDYEQAMLDHEQHVEQRAQDHDLRRSDRQQDREQRQRDRERRRLDRHRDREQRRRDHDQRRLERQQNREQRRSGGAHATPQRPLEHRHSDIFTAGPSGRPYRDPESAQAQSTEPVTPPTPFEEEEASMDEQGTASASQQTEPVAATDRNEDQASTTEPTPDDRLTILELLERGEIDIDEAMARLETEREMPSQ